MGAGVTGEQSGPPGKIPAFAETALVAAAATLLTVGLQIHLGAYGAEFGYDESSHYVSGLLIHDYLAKGLPHSPIGYLRDFASAYPQVGIGHWGPLWYGVEAVWMFLFGWSRTAMLAFSAFITVAIAVILYVTARPLGRLLAIFSALAMVASPIAQLGSTAVMLDSAITLMCLLAAISWLRYTQTLKARYSIAFGVLAGAALLIKGNAGCLVLVPPLFLLLDRNWSLLRRASFWAPAAIVLLIAGPWSVFSYHQVAQGFRFGWGWPYISFAVPENFRVLVMAFGPLLLLLVPLGMLPLLRPRDKSIRDLSALGFVLLAAVVIFQCVVPAAIQERYLEPALPPLILLAALGIHQIATRPAVRLVLVAAVVLVALPGIVKMEPKLRYGLVEATEQIWRYRLADNPSVLVVADGASEGAAVAEIAMLDNARPSMFAVRGTRLLGGGGYNTQEYQPRFTDLHDVLKAIDQYAIPLVLVRRERGRKEWAHIAQVDAARQLEPERWRVLYNRTEGATSVTLYEVKGNDGKKLDAGQLKQLTAPRGL